MVSLLGQGGIGLPQAAGQRAQDLHLQEYHLSEEGGRRLPVLLNEAAAHGDEGQVIEDSGHYRYPGQVAQMAQVEVALH